MEKTLHKLKEVCLEITDICTMECMHCSGSCGLTAENTLSLAVVKRIIGDFAHMGGELLEISGGEPLMHPNLFEIIRRAKMNRLEAILYTSGMASDKHGREFSISSNLAAKLRRFGIDKVVFNLQGSSAEMHDSITQKKGSFKNVVHSIRTMKSLGCWVGVHFVPMKPNHLDLKHVIRLCHTLGVDEIGLLRFVPQGRGLINRGLLELSKRQFQEFMENVVELKASHENPKIRIGRPINFCPLIDTFVTREECNAGITRCLISPEGNVVPCPAFKQNGDYIAGNVKMDSLADIWRYSPKWGIFRQFDYTKMREPCRSCEHLHWCQGGCKAQRILAHKKGDIYTAPDPHCFASSSRRKALVRQVC